MPDVTSTLLAMYQQIIGGSTSREQSSVEAECARRVILSGLTIAPNGTFTVPGNVTIGGSLTVTGSFSLLGLLTVGSLTVTGNASVGGTLTVTGVGGHTITATAAGFLGLGIVNGFPGGGSGAQLLLGNDVSNVHTVLQCQSSGYSSVGMFQANGTVLYTAQAGGLTLGASHAAGVVHVHTGAAGAERLRIDQTGLVSALNGLAVTGAVTATGTGTVAHAFTTSGVGALQVSLGQSTGGSGNFVQFLLGNDLSVARTVVAQFSSTYAGAAPNFADGTSVIANGVNGLSLGTSANADLRCYTNNAERLRIQGAGALLIGLTTLPGPTWVAVQCDSGHIGPIVVDQSAAQNQFYLQFLNTSLAMAGGIQHSGATSVVYTTTSDARLKRDRGVATDLAALRAVVVHDFAWLADETVDRGVFAQEAHAFYPRAIVAGTDARTATGALAQPWMTDYSKFVPDLIVGWQQHEADLAEIRAMLAHRRSA